MSQSILAPSHHLVSIQTETATVRVIDVTDCIPDITANLISTSQKHSNLPTDLFENLVFQALNDLVDDFGREANPLGLLIPLNTLNLNTKRLLMTLLRNTSILNCTFRDRFMNGDRYSLHFLT